ncbi:urease accessory protein UreD [bacterium SCN 62-11]|nr:urease accessory protein UreD [Candidatus Eremiobacteraeota bacterium]ODT57241.1 MAG: urease accessory protein UreD [bacterium SCN 62-11]
MPSGTVGKDGYLRLAFQKRPRRTILTDLQRRVPLFVHKPLYWDEAMPELACVFLICTSAGFSQGDRYRMEFQLGPEARVHLTTQSNTQIHSMDANYAAQTQEIELAENAYLEYLPDPICPHRNSRFYSHTRVRAHPTATLLYSETLQPGRRHHRADELFGYDLFSSHLSVENPEGKHLMAEKFLLQPKTHPLRRKLLMADYEVFANVLLVTPPHHAAAVLQATPALYQPDLAAGVSLLPNGAGLLYKVLGQETAPVQAQVRHFWNTVRTLILHKPARAPFLWR